MPAPETDVERVRRYCDTENRLGHTDQLRIEFELDNNTVTLFEHRAPWDGRSEEWMREDFARLRWSPSNGNWTLYWLDRNFKWHKYSRIGPGSMQAALREVDLDPTYVFKG
ncbi:MAG: DUF3024 domain-containing protein [Acidimicrobiales bacterium]